MRDNGTASDVSRRQFLKRVSATAAGATLTASGVETILAQDQAQLEWRNKQPEMRYRRLGRTNFMVSELAFGGSFVTPDNINIVDWAIERGVNYVDTSSGYARGLSEPALGSLLQGQKRDKVFLVTKVAHFLRDRSKLLRDVFAQLPPKDKDQYTEKAKSNLAARGVQVEALAERQRKAAVNAEVDNLLESEGVPGVDRGRYVPMIVECVEGSMSRLKTDVLDIIVIPGRASSPYHANLPEVHEAFAKLKKAGKVRALGITTHANIAETCLAAIDNGKYDMIMPSYNVLNHRELDSVLEAAKKKDVGVVAMKGARSVAKRLAEANPNEKAAFPKCYRWVLENPNVACVVAAMKNHDEAKANIGIPTMKLPPAAKDALEKLASAAAADQCRMCGVCRRACPMGVAIPDILRARMYYEDSGDEMLARHTYADLCEWQQATACLDCGKCEAACPSGLRIREAITDVHRRLA